MNGDGLDFAPNVPGLPDGLAGNVVITGSAISAPDAGAVITDTSGTLNLTVTGTRFGGGYGGLDLAAIGNAAADAPEPDMTVSVTGSTFNGNVDHPYQAFQFDAYPTDAYPTGTPPVPVSSDSVTFTGNTVGTQGGAVGISADGSSTVCATITGNSINGPAGNTNIVLNQDGPSTIELPGYTGGPGDTSAVERFLRGGNTGTPTVRATVSGSGGGFSGAPGC